MCRVHSVLLLWVAVCETMRMQVIRWLDPASKTEKLSLKPLLQLPSAASLMSPRWGSDSPPVAGMLSAAAWGQERVGLFKKKKMEDCKQEVRRNVKAKTDTNTQRASHSVMLRAPLCRSTPGILSSSAAFSSQLLLYAQSLASSHMLKQTKLQWLLFVGLKSC